MTDITIPVYDEDWFLGKYLSALPDGPAWNKNPGSNMYEAISALMPTYARVAAASGNMIVDSFPATTTNLLTEWQSSTGLPDPCLGDNPTLAQERMQIVARLIDNGGQSLEYLQAAITSLGYQSTITTFRPALAGVDRAGKCRALPAQSCNWILINLERVPTDPSRRACPARG